MYQYLLWMFYDFFVEFQQVVVCQGFEFEVIVVEIVVVNDVGIEYFMVFYNYFVDVICDQFGRLVGFWIDVYIQIVNYIGE